MPDCEYSNSYRRGSREFAKISLARPWDAHGEVATSGNAGGLHIFAEAGLKRIGVPTRTIQQVLHPKRRSFPGPLRYLPTVLPLATAPQPFQITPTTLSYLRTRKYISDALVRPLQRDLPTLDRLLHRGPRRTCLSHLSLSLSYNCSIR